jgi:ABC-type Mn2+/Zn2+ transport system permease subunit
MTIPFLPALLLQEASHTDPVAHAAAWLVIILVAAKLGGEVATRIGQPSVLGELVIGVVLGNLALVGFTGLEPIKTDEFIDMLARVGVLLLLFEVGLESTVGQMLKVGMASLAVAVLGVVTVFGRELYVLCQDEEVAKASGLPVRFLSLLIAVTAALTVVIAMRVVGLLLVSALMVVPVATSQQLTRGFVSTMFLSMLFGMIATVGGLTSSFYIEVPPGAIIVIVALVGFVLALGLGRFVRRSRPQESSP